MKEKTQSQAYLYNNQTKILDIIDKNQVLKYVGSTDKDLLNKSYLEIVRFLLFKKMEGKEVYYYVTSDIKHIIIVTFNLTIDQLRNILKLKPKNTYNLTFLDGSKYRFRDVKEVLNKNTSTLNIKIPLTLNLSYFIGGGIEAESDINKDKNSLLRIKLHSSNWNEIKKKIEKEIQKQLISQSKCKLHELYTGGWELMQLPSEITIK